MKYTWNPQVAFELTSIPKAAAAHLKFAGERQLRVLVWLCCIGQGSFDAAACSRACGGSPQECEEAVIFWEQRGVITVSDKAAPAPAPQPAPASNSAPVPQARPEPTATPPASPSTAVTVPPMPQARPTRQQVLSRRATDEQFAFLLDTAAAKLGKVLSPADMAVYLYIYEELKLPPEVILMIIGYAVNNGKARLSYIEKTAIHWAESGIVTFEAADRHLCHLEHCRTAWETVAAIGKTDIARPTLAQKEAACRWIYEWKLPHEVIEAAMRYTEERLGKLQISYVDRLLERLHADGVTTAAQAKAALAPAKDKPAKKSAGRMKTASDRAPSFDLGHYEEMAMRHRPQLPDEED